MPYEPPPPEWLNGKEAIDQIRVDINQSVDKAIQQLKAAMAHRAVAVRLAGKRPLPVHCSLEMWADADICPDGTIKFSDHPPRSFEVLRSHLLRYWPATRRGWKPKLNHQVITDKVFELMDFHGEFMDGDKWNCQARLEEAIAKYLNESVAPSTIRLHVVSALEQWRKRK
jgi:hypothetical protein